MKKTWQRWVASGVMVAAIVVPVIVLAASQAPAAQASRSTAGVRPAATPECRSSNLEIWLGLNPDGAAAGTTWYPLEFSNVGFHTHTCWIAGAPHVRAVDNSNTQIGPQASRTGHPNRITLRPGQTAHALLGIVQSGFITGCANATGAGLKVTVPGQHANQPIESFTFPACTNKVFMHSVAVKSGVGIP
jgi:hypothetical protein